MRLPRLSKSNGLVAKYSLQSAAAAALLAMGVGCEVKSFIDPSELGRMERTPLTMPILTSLDTGVEEANDEFLNAGDPTPEDLIANRVDYRLDRGDLVNISISDLQAAGVDTVRSVRVSESGNASLPYIGQIRALGMTEAELEAAVVEAYRAAALITNAQVSVTVAEARGRAFSILGAVQQPGQYAIIQSEFRVLDALVLARDTTAPTIEYLYIIRQKSVDAAETAPPTVQPAPATGPAPDALEPKVDAGTDRLALRAVYLQTTDESVSNQPATLPETETGGRYITIDGKPVLIPGGDIDAAPELPETTQPAVAAATTEPAFEFNEAPGVSDTRVIRIPIPQLRNGELKYNIVIKPQDMIIVPQPVVGEYYMGGHVNRVGVYSLTGRDITLKQAVVSAGMLDQLAIPQRTDLIRRIGKDKEIFVRVDLAKIWEGAQPDIFLKPNDVVQVGTNFLAPFLAAIRGGFRVTYGFGFLYDRNYADERQTLDN
ncbi:MAG TPA: polysaccharide biosynthesis/export family protein [Tepidisphaeraceae bacterium]|nr:polysaccharide biosynthesis/export family protein [Tepidisphaeraceae bacterium]